jgi:hypothetical protein
MNMMKKQAKAKNIQLKINYENICSADEIILCDNKNIFSPMIISDDHRI